MKSTFKEILSYKKTHSLIETGKKFKISSERVRQIALLKFQKYCKRHDRYYYNKCSYCLNMTYYALIKKFSYKELIKEAQKESENRRRDALSVFRRLCIINELKDKYQKSYSEIGRLLKRDRTTISHLYVNKK